MDDIQNQMQGTQEEIVRCPNFMLCNSSHPQWVADCNHGVCMNCAMFFAGRLEFINKLEKCSICHERKDNSNSAIIILAVSALKNVQDGEMTRS